MIAPLWCIAALAIAASAALPAMASPQDCKRAPPTPVSDLTAILAQHKNWLDSKDDPRRSGAQADLRSKDLTDAKLQGADLREALLSGAKLDSARLDDADLTLARLDCVVARGAWFPGAKLFETNLADATLTGAKFTKSTQRDSADLGGAVLSGADLDGADFTAADLRGAKFISASVINTRLADSQVASLDVANAVWQPLDVPKSGIGDMRNLALLRLDEKQFNPIGMGLLLKALREAGADAQARDLVSARERAETKRLWREFSSARAIGSGVQALWRSAVWGLLTDYGRRPGVALFVAFIVAVAMTAVYFFLGFRGGNTDPGICQVHAKGRIEEDAQGLTVADKDQVRRLQVPHRGKRAAWALLFSLLSSLRIGVGQFNVIELLKRLSSTDVDLTAYGPLRAVSGVQSVVTFLLLGLWAYALFGRPFE